MWEEESSGEFGAGVRNRKPKTSILIGKLLIAVVLSFAVSSPAYAAQDQQIQQKLGALQKIQGKFSFIVIGDNRSGDDIYKKIVARAVDRKPDFIINTGDVITTPGNLQQWGIFWEMSKPITVPYFLTVGNHDAHPKVRDSEQIYKEQVDLPGNELYYSFAAGNSLFIILDSYINNQEKKVAGEQLKWLEGVLTSQGRKHTFVFIHHPLYPERGKGKHHGNSLDRYKDDRDRLQQLFKKHNVTMVFTGHEHMYLRKTVDGISHVITGGGGAPLYAADKDGGFYHFIQITVDRGKVNAEVVDINGKVRDRF